MIGKQLAHYEITALIGKGGMGEVYRATDTKLGRDVALKVLPAGFDDDTDRLARFQREARTLASLQHPNVASIYGLESADGQTFLVMELVEGEDLSQRLARGAVSLDRILDIAGQIATGLEAAHDKGIVHRDLKPANVKLGEDGSVKILDFGLARAYEGDPAAGEDPAMTPTLTAAMTRAGVILGTAAYMSPEQARGKQLDKRTDIFSFGIVLYEMLTGSRAFGGDTMSDVLASILKEQPDRDALPAKVPPAIRLLLDRCLEKDPKKRIRDIGEARLIIEAVQDGDTTASVILGSGVGAAAGAPATGSSIRPREIAAWLAAAVAVVILGVTLFGGGEDPLPPAMTTKFTIPIAGDSRLETEHGGLAVSPDGTRIAYIDRNRLYVRSIDSWDPVAIPGAEGAQTPFWSPAGDWLAYTSGKDIWRVRPDGTQRALVCTTGLMFSGTSGGAWLADDRIVFRDEQDLLAVTATGGKPVVFVSTADSTIVDFHEPEALPDGQGLVVVVHRPEGVDTIAVVALDGTLTRLLTIPETDLGEPCYSPSGHILFQRAEHLWAVAFSLGEQRIVGEPFPVERNTANPSVSREGTLVFVRNAAANLRQLVLVDRSGAVVGRLGQPDDIWAAYAMSPDGSRAVSMNADQEDIYLQDDRLARTRVTFSDVEHDMASFSRDGNTVYFATGTETSYSIGSKRVDRDEPEKMLVPPGDLGPHYYAACPVATADGKRLFYTTIGADEKQDIAWLDLTGDQQPQRWLAGAAREFAANPSPADPAFVAYVSDESGARQVYLTTWPDADRKLPVSIDGGDWPHWKGDGTEIYFAHANDIYAVTVSYQPLRLGTPQKLFSRPENDARQPFGWPATFDVTADGERFLVTEIVGDTSLKPEVAIVQNWAAEYE